MEYFLFLPVLLRASYISYYTLIIVIYTCLGKPLMLRSNGTESILLDFLSIYNKVVAPNCLLGKVTGPQLGIWGRILVSLG